MIAHSTNNCSQTRCSCCYSPHFLLSSNIAIDVVVGVVGVVGVVEVDIDA
jgi:hypothetical protein